MISKTFEFVFAEIRLSGWNVKFIEVENWTRHNDKSGRNKDIKNDKRDKYSDNLMWLECDKSTLNKTTLQESDFVKAFQIQKLNCRYNWTMFIKMNVSFRKYDQINSTFLKFNRKFFFWILVNFKFFIIRLLYNDFFPTMTSI